MGGKDIFSINKRAYNFRRVSISKLSGGTALTLRDLLPLGA